MMNATAARDRYGRRPDEELLLLCSRNVVEPDALARIGDVAKAVDWSSLLRLTLHHRVVPLVHHALLRAPAGTAPKPVLAALARHYASNATRSMHLLAALAGLSARFEAEGIATLAYKGPALALRIYGNACRRQFADLDFLVEPQDYARTCELLVADGFQRGADWGWECSLVDSRRGICVDLHRAIVQDAFPLRLEFARVYRRSERLPVGTTMVGTPCAEDMLLILCLQFAKDAAGESPLRLSKLCDIAELVRAHAALDWTAALREARALGVERVLYFGLVASQRFLGAPFPDRLAETRVLRNVDLLIEHVRRRLFDEMDGHASRRLSQARFHFLVRERWRDKLYPARRALGSRLVPNDRDRALVALPPSLDGLYYAVRPIRLLKDASACIARWLYTNAPPFNRER